MTTRETRTHPAHDQLGRSTQDPTYREIHDESSLRELTQTAASLTGWRLQGVDLTPHAEALSQVDVRGLVVLGGHVPQGLAHDLVSRGAVILPTDPHCPVDAYRSELYTPLDLYDGIAQSGYASTLDARTYAWSRDAHTQHDAYATLLRAMHDDSIHDALVEALHGQDSVGVMGGHALARDSPDYAAAAHLGHLLAAAGRVVLTGGGPGAMEAANFGALATSSGGLDDGLARLATVPSFRPSIEHWATLALDVRAQVAATGSGQVRSIGIPTWFYGHEPPNVFCNGIAKYFSNALREDILLSQSTGGLIVLPGAAGTVQEIFQAATPLYYAGEDDPLPPLVLVGTTHWQETVPVWPALRALGANRPMGTTIHLVNTAAEAAAIVLD